MARMTKLTKSNIEAAELATVESLKDGGGFVVCLTLNGKSSYISDGQGPIIYDNPNNAGRAIKRINPGLFIVLSPSI